MTYAHVSGPAAADLLPDLRDLYFDVYQEPPYHWGSEHADLFAERFHSQSQAPGFDLVTARDQETLVGFTFGVTLLPNTPWWQDLVTPIDPVVTRERAGRTFALVELLVRHPWRRQGIAARLHDELLAHRPEERATLTVLPAATPAQHAYADWGWHRVAQKRNPLPGSPVFDVMVKALP
ncbi:GNAT family N-acetyltransferase [Amycolatopsis nigrescens]|uniref:GNAT family N-acetyltransferase n=1 Tax=Amycolatopsis nigrescens TaxID=381445 RepID=UPI0004772C7B|nr:GNAT family N-acetyltransferase [Amycolatopsis nigrescens]